MIYRADDLRVVREDLRDARAELERARVEGPPERVKRAQAWVTGAEELERKVTVGLGEQNIREAAKVLGAMVERGKQHGHSRAV